MRPPQLSITIDVEDHAGEGETPRFREALAPLMSALTEARVRATFFVVGEMVTDFADDLRELARQGHEIGLHGYTHRFLRDLGPEGLADELARGRAVLTDALGAAPVGFRAPYFSLTADTPWAPDVIAAAGFTYSSSVLPAWNPQAGLATAPRRPFRWPNGLVELPSPVFGVGKWALPVLGGAYLRLAPAPLVRLAARSTGDVRGAWTYSHPYDFDADEPFVRRGEQSWLFAKLLFARRSLMLRRVMLLADPRGVTLADLAADRAFTDALPTIDPFG